MTLGTVDGAWITFQDQSNERWLAALDRETRAIRAGTELRIGDRAAPLRRTFNVPEFGLDVRGLRVHYTRVGNDGLFQSARVSVVDGAPLLEILTTGVEYFSPLASKDPNDSSTGLVMLRRPPEWGAALWVDDVTPRGRALPLPDREPVGPRRTVDLPALV